MQLVVRSGELAHLYEGVAESLRFCGELKLESEELSGVITLEYVELSGKIGVDESHFLILSRL